MKRVYSFSVNALLFAVTLTTAGIAVAIDFVEPESYLGYGYIAKMCISPDNARALIMGSRAAVVDLSTAHDLYTFPPVEYLRDGAWSADGEYIAVAGSMDTIVVSATSFKQVPRFDSLPSGVRSLAFSFDGKYLAVSLIAEVQLWSIEEGRVLHSWPVTEPVVSLAFAREVNLLVAGSRITKVWNADTGVEVRAFVHPNDEISFEPGDGRSKLYEAYLTYANISPDGTRVVTGTIEINATDKSAILYEDCLFWNVASGQVYREGASAGQKASFSPDGKNVLYDSGFLVQEAPGVDIGPLFPSEASRANAAVFSPDGTIVLLHAQDTLAQELTTVDPLTKNVLHVVPNINSYFAMSRNGRFVLFPNLRNRMSLYDRQSETYRELPITATATFYSAISDDGDNVVNISSDYVLRIRSAATGTLRHSIQLAGMPYSISYMADGNRLLLLGNSIGVEIWDITSGAKLHDFGDDVERAILDKQESRILLQGKNSLELLDSESESILWKLELPSTAEIHHSAWAPNGDEILLAMKNKGLAPNLVIVSSHSGEVLRELSYCTHYSGIYRAWADYALGGDVMIATCDAQSYQILDAESGNVLREISAGYSYANYNYILPEGSLMRGSSATDFHIVRLDSGPPREGEGDHEGEGAGDGAVEGQEEGINNEGEGAGETAEGDGTQDGEGVTLEGEALPEGIEEGGAEGGGDGMPEGSYEGMEEGAVEGGGETEGEGEGTEEGNTEGEADGEDAPRSHHSADSDDDGFISLHELLRVIQLHNGRAYRCDRDRVSEDGYALASPSDSFDQDDCRRHSSDYADPAGQIGLSEVLRLIQLYQFRYYHPCLEVPDNFCLS